MRGICAPCQSDGGYSRVRGVVRDALLLAGQALLQE